MGPSKSKEQRIAVQVWIERHTGYRLTAMPRMRIDVDCSCT